MTLDLPFMVPGSMPSGVTFTRASTATYFDATGTMQTATANTPRWDYDPVTHALRGLLIEEARTNLLLNSATLGTQSVTTTAAATTLSFYGTGTVTLSGTSTAGPLTGTGSTNRVSLTFTPTAGTLTCTVTGTVSNAQLEAGAFPTSYIPTTAAAVLRQIDNATLPTSTWYSAAASSLAADFMEPQSPNPAAVSRDVCGLSDGTSSNRMILRGLVASANTALFSSVTSGTAGASTSLGVVTAGAVSKIAAAWNGVTPAGVLNGGAAVSYSAGQPVGINILGIGNQAPPGGATLNGWVRRVRYWPRALTNTELQSVTT